MPDPSATVARLAGAVKRYGPQRALDGLDLALHRGEIRALPRPSRCRLRTVCAGMLEVA